MSSVAASGLIAPRHQQSPWVIPGTSARERKQDHWQRSEKHPCSAQQYPTWRGRRIRPPSTTWEDCGEGRCAQHAPQYRGPPTQQQLPHSASPWCSLACHCVRVHTPRGLARCAIKTAGDYPVSTQPQPRCCSTCPKPTAQHRRSDLLTTRAHQPLPSTSSAPHTPAGNRLYNGL